MKKVVAVLCPFFLLLTSAAAEKKKINGKWKADTKWIDGENITDKDGLLKGISTSAEEQVTIDVDKQMIKIRRRFVFPSELSGVQIPGGDETYVYSLKKKVRVRTWDGHTYFATSTFDNETLVIKSVSENEQPLSEERWAPSADGKMLTWTKVSDAKTEVCSQRQLIATTDTQQSSQIKDANEIGKDRSHCRQGGSLTVLYLRK